MSTAPMRWASTWGSTGPRPEPTSDDPRSQLQGFIDAVVAQVGSDAQAYEPAAYLIRATPVTDMSVYEMEPTVVAWPLDVDLATADECAQIPAADIADTFADATELTFFEQAGTTYQLAVKPLLPGDAC